jgi:hypothetical protein
MADGEFQKPVSAMLARALAEAAAGFPRPVNAADASVYFVASYEAVPASDEHSNPPDEDLPAHTFNGLFNIQPAYATHAEAKGRADELGPGYAVFGPFRSTFAAPKDGQATVTTMRLHTSDGGHVNIPTEGFRPPEGLNPPPPEFDALFFTADAVAKFALSYYSGIYGNGFGREVLTKFQKAHLALMGHLPWSEYTEIQEIPGHTSRKNYVSGIPVLLHPDGQGGYHRQPIHPGTPATAGAA